MVGIFLYLRDQRNFTLRKTYNYLEVPVRLTVVYTPICIFNNILSSLTGVVMKCLQAAAGA